jgi:hypothetical protein
MLVGVGGVGKEGAVEALALALASLDFTAGVSSGVESEAHVGVRDLFERGVVDAPFATHDALLLAEIGFRLVVVNDVVLRSGGGSAFHLSDARVAEFVQKEMLLALKSHTKPPHGRTAHHTTPDALVWLHHREFLCLSLVLLLVILAIFPPMLRRSVLQLLCQLRGAPPCQLFQPAIAVHSILHH